jgi:MarR family transcriptional regulator, organic hydroperoxide resistance regulator
MNKSRTTRGARRAAPHAKALQPERMLEVLRQFRVLFRAIKQHYRRVEERAGVSGAQLWAMERVAAAPGIGVGQLARELAVHQSTASNLVHRLADEQLIERRREGADLRNVQLYLTPKGEEVVSRAPPPLQGVLQHALSTLPAESLAALQQRLGELIAAVQELDESARATPLSEL